MRIVLTIVSALIFLVVVATIDADARYKRKQARLHTQQSTHLKARVVPGRSAYAQWPTFGGLATAQLRPNSPPIPAPLAYGSTVSWDSYGVRWD